jgi:hypothetical protein
MTATRGARRASDDDERADACATDAGASDARSDEADAIAADAIAASARPARGPLMRVREKKYIPSRCEGAHSYFDTLACKLDPPYLTPTRRSSISPAALSSSLFPTWLRKTL